MATKLYAYPLDNETDFYFETQSGDRYDNLADEFYNDSSLYWVIPAINNLPKDTLYPEVGIQLRMISDVNNYLEFLIAKNR